MQLLFKYFRNTNKKSLIVLLTEIKDWNVSLINTFHSQLQHQDVFWTASYENKIIGFAAMTDNSSLYINLAVVHPEYRRKGVGTMLIQMIKTFYCDDINLWADLEKVEIAKFYLKLGFLPILVEDAQKDYERKARTIHKMTQSNWETWRHALPHRENLHWMIWKKHNQENNVH